jgi:voltage-gated potassium channel
MKTRINLRNIIEAFIIILIIVDLVLLMLITFTTVSQSLFTTIIYFDLMVCIILFFDFIYRMQQEEDKKAFIKHNWPDIIAMIPFDILSLSPSYIFFARFFRLFRLIRLLTLFRREWKYISSFFKQTHINIAIGMLLFTVFAGTILFYLLEHGINQGVHTIWDAMWYTVTTMLTGNSNINPVTPDGEVISVLMIIMGISFVGILTASLASWLIKKSTKTEDDIEEGRLKNIETSMDDIKNEIIELKELLKDKL